MTSDEYKAACDAHAREQGVDVVIAELAKRGIEAALWQTGGYTMCFGIAVGGGRFVIGNASGASLLASDDYCDPDNVVETICQFAEDEHRGVEVAEAVAAWIAKGGAA